MAKGSPRDYVEAGSEDVSELSWDGGAWGDGESWEPEEGGIEDVEAGSEDYEALPTGAEGEGESPEVPAAPVGGSPAAHWREELQTTAQRIQYVNNVLGLSRGDDGYSNALRYLGLIASGQREPESERWLNVRRAAEVNYELKHRDIPPPAPTPGGPKGPGSFKRGDYLTGAMSWQMTGEDGRREVAGTITLEGESLRLANDGQLAQAFIQGYFDGDMS